MEPWYKIAKPRKEVREGRSFNPDEFAIHLEQVISRAAPEDYLEPEQFKESQSDLTAFCGRVEYIVQ
ncbi:MAG: hypothetical protein JRI35_05450 [Deltaproteobacteria bacterium]|nr:hypothetical protein [Deltaproteobacteria bacterium]MBW1947177.1 hypothetical protein [Deltaproteobacteria bacterium]MBW1967463.1 hypothetical protein [Deltaproteobacteria bacterium]MBW2098524.1 hypothetical protein [Deltaproteobacteria bacterium]